jgi:hypothetical protein
MIMKKDIGVNVFCAGPLLRRPAENFDFLVKLKE